jgi:transcriptional regulator with XRE-family HTH domain
MNMIDKILRRLEEMDMDQGELESAANRISKWKGGTGEPTASQAFKMARVLRLSLDYLLDDAIEEQVIEDVNLRSRVLWLAEQITYETAIKRLTLAPESRAPKEQSYDEIRDAQRRARRRREGEGPNNGA